MDLEHHIQAQGSQQKGCEAVGVGAEEATRMPVGLEHLL